MANISEDTKKKLKALLASYLDHQEEMKSIRDNVSDIIKDAADLLEKKPAAVRKAFTALKKRYETGEDETDDFFTIVTLFDSEEK